MPQPQLCSLSAWKVGDRAYLVAIVEDRDYTAYVLSPGHVAAGYGYRSTGEARGGLCDYMEGLLNAAD